MSDTSPELLSYDDLVRLTGTDSIDESLEQRLNELLSQPIVSNAAARSGSTDSEAKTNKPGSGLRVALWNLERGYNLDQIRMALKDPAGLMNQAQNTAIRSEAERQVNALSAADVFVFNEVDLGVSRSGYRDVARELAEELQMNYAFAVEFLEVDPLLLGLEEPKGDVDSVKNWRATHPLDKERFRGLHGNAVLSRYPILSARVVRLPECYDWYGREKKSIAELERGRRWTAKRLFSERISREIRRGGRNALVTTLQVPDAPGGVVTVVSTHLENKCRPACRQVQMDAVMKSVSTVPHAVVLAGDLNTTGSDAAPTSIRREITRRASSLKFWLAIGIRYLSPVSIPQFGLLPVNHLKNYHDPSAFHVPIFLPNREDRLFTRVRKFQFADGGSFDFTGSRDRNRQGRSRTLANSNQRSFKGFTPTFAFERTYGGLVGSYKLDWIFVKPAGDGLLSPQFPSTMNELNIVTGSRISDHPPITVDLRMQPEAVLSGSR
jgi:endonuclease/exonuclease/phosphatase family metal-dependent hydrolase